VVTPLGIVTFLFTDIEGSTRRWDSDADGMRAALAAQVPGPLALIGVLLDRFGRNETAATIMGFAERPATRTTFPETATTIAHLREMLGGETYESLASDGASMTTAAAVNYALNEIERARADLIAHEQT